MLLDAPVTRKNFGFANAKTDHIGDMKFEGRRDLIRNVQRSLGIVADGQDGPVTWRSIYGAVRELRVELGFSGVGVEMVRLAKGEIGVSEVDGTNCGERVNEYKAATWLDSEKGWPWCAAFICWLVREAIEKESVLFDRPQTAGAWDFENWAKKQEDKGVELYKPVKSGNKPYVRAGDIVVFQFSHIGLAISEENKSGYIQTIEGNTNGAGSREGGSVLEKSRNIENVRSVIRIL